MSQTISVPNFSSLNIINDAGTKLTAQINTGVNSLPVQDVDDFSNSGFCLVGQKGSLISELMQIGTITTVSALPVTTLTQQLHYQYDPVYPLFGNQIRIYRAPNVDGTQPADTAFVLLTTINIDFSESLTSYTDATGGGGYWYKYTYYNSATTSETDLGSSRGVRGNFTVNYCSLDEVRNEAGFQRSTYIDDNRIDISRQAAQDEINGALAEFYPIPLQPPINDYLKRICIRLAAGYLRLGQYSQISDSNVNGQDMVDDAQKQITKLILKERELITKDGKSQAEVGAVGGAGGWPNDATATAGSTNGGAPRVFRMSDIQGQPLSADANDQPVGNLYYGRKW